MSRAGKAIAARALAAVGTAFAYRGRSAGIALDCVGLVAHAAGFDGALPGYALKAENSALIISTLDSCGFRRVRRGAYHVGDIVHVLCGPRQHHLLIRTQCGWVHAHAGLGRVVSLSGELPWPVVSIWRTKGV